MVGRSLGVGSSACSITWLMSSTKNDLERVEDVLRHLVEIRPAFARKDDSLDARPMRREDLGLDAADREHAAAQRALAGHRRVGAHAATR